MNNSVAPINSLTLSKSLLFNKNLWMLFTFTKYSDPKGTIKKFLDQNYIITEKKKFYDIDLFHYTKE